MDSKPTDESVLSLDEVFQDEETLRLTLTAEQWEVIISLAEIGGRGKLRELRQMTRMGSSVIQEVIKSLIAIGMVARADREPAPLAATGLETADAEVAAYLEYLRDLNYYQVLQLNAADDAGAVRRAYFRLMREYHPDRFMKEPNPTTREQLKEIFRVLTRAYETLADPQRRREYDLTIPDFTGARQKEDDLAFEALWSGDLGPGTLPETNPELAKSFFENALQDFRNEDYQAAELNFKLAAALDPKSDDYQAGLLKARRILHQRQAKELALKAVYFEEEGKRRAAIDSMKRAVELDPEAAEYRYDLARVLEEDGGDPALARMNILLALDRRPGRVDFLLLFARIQRRLGEIADARRTVRRVLSLDAGNAGARALLAAIEGDKS
jgi:curved DNA-binding protein CbpA